MVLKLASVSASYCDTAYHYLHSADVPLLYYCEWVSVSGPLLQVATSIESFIPDQFRA